MKLKYKILFLLVVSFFYTTSFAQSSAAVITQETINSQEGYPVDPRPLLEKLSKAAGIDLNNIEPVPPRLGKVAWNFNVGSKGPYSDGWWAHDLSGTIISFYQTPATCRAVGDNCYIFVEDAQWNNGRVDQAAVNKILEAFDSKNALPNSTKGIYDTNVEFFGNPPNVDLDQRIIILILDVIDGYTEGGAYTAGYFYSYNQGNASNSNKAEVFYLDANPLNLKTATGNSSLETGLSITAHEFQHMIHWESFRGTGTTSQTFINESMSELASFINGYQLRSTDRFAVEPNQFLFEWRDGNDVLIDYSRAARFSLYLKEQFGDEFFRKYHQNKITDINGINTALMTMSPSSSRRFADIIEDWFVANYLHNVSYNSKFGYTLANQQKSSSLLIVNPNVSLTTDNVYKYGARYLTYKGGSNLNITFNNFGNSGIKVRAMKIGTGTTEVVNVPLNTTFSVPDFGTTFNEVTFVIYYNNVSLGALDNDKGPHNFSYTSSGTVTNSTTELAYDTPYNDSYTIGIEANSKQGVVFEGVSSSRLNKIKVYLNSNNNSLPGEVWSYTGSSAAPLGSKLSTSITATNPNTTGSWIEIDVANQNISTVNRFLIVFQIAANASNGGTMVLLAKKPGTTFGNSIFYRPSTGTWIYFTDGAGNIWLNRIRAIVEIPTGIGTEEVELLPVAYSLEQNYPNPFNPETVISFSLPKSGNVQIKVYDVLGKEIKTLMSEDRTAGNHKIYWNATDDHGRRVSSGVYFYTISSGDFIQTKKMVLMK
ncbi:MAG TPA: T9SS type A sorting domain-containing protein [Melioribacteraceae bacterium]|nr:T9SS type A sorting domain-containing protein [Melioribacteraceae bacterium]